MSRTPKAAVLNRDGDLVEVEQPAAAVLPALTIQFDLYQLTVDDLPLVHAMRRGQASDEAVVELFNRVVVGGAKMIPFPKLGEACKAFYRAVFNAGEPETPAGN
jgi:hypothetical protein